MTGWTTCSKMHIYLDKSKNGALQVIVWFSHVIVWFFYPRMYLQEGVSYKIVNAEWKMSEYRKIWTRKNSVFRSNFMTVIKRFVDLMRNWQLVQKSSGFNPEWFCDTKLLLVKNLSILSYNNVSNILPEIGTWKIEH